MLLMGPGILSFLPLRPRLLRGNGSLGCRAQRKHRPLAGAVTLLDHFLLLHLSRAEALLGLRLMQVIFVPAGAQQPAAAVVAAAPQVPEQQRLQGRAEQRRRSRSRSRSRERGRSERERRRSKSRDRDRGRGEREREGERRRSRSRSRVRRRRSRSRSRGRSRERLPPRREERHRSPASKDRRKEVGQAERSRAGLCAATCCRNGASRCFKRRPRSCCRPAQALGLWCDSHGGHALPGSARIPLPSAHAPPDSCAPQAPPAVDLATTPGAVVEVKRGGQTMGEYPTLQQLALLPKGPGCSLHEGARPSLPRTVQCRPWTVVAQLPLAPLLWPGPPIPPASAAESLWSSCKGPVT